MRLQADKLREKLLAAVANNEGVELEAARAEKTSALRGERELEEMIRSNAEKVREASEKKKNKKRKGYEDEEEEEDEEE